MRELENRMSLSKTVIAVVGDTGSGKSSLMNALLDQLDILPTSGMRACTAVVVEVVSNTTNNKYEADITFLSREVSLIQAHHLCPRSSIYCMHKDENSDGKQIFELAI